MHLVKGQPDTRVTCKCTVCGSMLSGDTAAPNYHLIIFSLLAPIGNSCFFFALPPP